MRRNTPEQALIAELKKRTYDQMRNAQATVDRNRGFPAMQAKGKVKAYKWVLDTFNALKQEAN